MKKISSFTLIMASLLGATALASCGPNDEDNGVLTIAIVSDNSESKTMKTFVDGYKAIPGNENKEIRVVKMNNYDDYVRNSFLYDDLADIVQVFDYSAEYFCHDDMDGLGTTLLQPISDLMERDGIKESDFFDSIISMCKCGVDDQVYWMPRDYNKVVCAYNRDIFDLAGVSYPTDNWTWDEMVNICRQLDAKKADIKENYSHSGSFYSIDLNLNFPAVYYPIMKSYGGDLIETSTGKVFGSDTTASKNALEKVYSLVDEKLAPIPSDQIPFTNKQAAMMFIVRPNLPTYVNALGKDSIDFVSLPTYEDNGDRTDYIGMGCSGYGITTLCPESKRDFAWDFLKYIVSEDGQNKFSETGSGIPSIKRLALAEDAAFRQFDMASKYAPNHGAFVDHSERDLPMNYMKGFQPKKQQAIYQFITARMLGAFIKAKDRDKYFEEFKRDLEQLWK